jgi:hypothetical protein
MNGVRKNASGIEVQRYFCKKCGKSFTDKGDIEAFKKYEDKVLDSLALLIQQGFSFKTIMNKINKINFVKSTKYHFETKIMVYAIYEANKDKMISSRQIVGKIHKKLRVNVSHTTIINWNTKFSEKQWNLKNGSHREDVREIISKGNTAYCKTQNSIPISKKTRKRILGLFFDKLSLRQISRTIKHEEKIKISVSKIYDILQEESLIMCKRKAHHYHTIDSLLENA